VTRIDDPLDQIEFTQREDNSKLLLLATVSNLAAPVIALLTSPAGGALAALSAVAAQFFADHRKEARVIAFQQGFRESLRDVSGRLDALQNKMSGPDAEEAMIVAMRVVLNAARLDQARSAGMILGATLEQDSPQWRQAAEFIRDLEQFTDDDITALRIIWSVQKVNWQHQTLVAPIDMSTDANDYTKDWKQVLSHASEKGFSPDEWYSRIARLSGFGLALQVQSNLAHQGPDAVCYRLTGRAARLMKLLGVLVDPREYPRVLYHRTNPPRTVQDHEEERRLGPEWAHSPNAFLS
jgi:hypothetical protein